MTFIVRLGVSCQPAVQHFRLTDDLCAQRLLAMQRVMAMAREGDVCAMMALLRATKPN